MLHLQITRLIALTMSLTVIICMASCDKPKGPATDYRINGIKDIVLPENGSEKMELSVELQSENAEQVTLSVEGVPSGVTANFDRVTDKPSFVVSLYLKDDS